MAENIDDFQNDLGVLCEETLDIHRLMAGFDHVVSVFGSARIKPESPHYERAMAITSALSQRGYNMVTGGGPGIMEAACRGGQAGIGSTIGLNVTLPNEQKANPWIDFSMHCSGFYPRKIGLIAYSEAFIVFPGGMGTLDELFEALVMMQTKKIAPAKVILVGRDFWAPLLTWLKETLYAQGYFEKTTLSALYLCDTQEEVLSFFSEVL